ncbi:unnamed protein product [Owenia fusiformis]|uniref:Calcineurin-like phosphoesterase domain-containing protein n=1 Tax=Owenia fusiformis TaxID=6347 RepID=A0A8J1U2T3_OWEFU|nr:unnamed protein product [Owenia fusiformis]
MMATRPRLIFIALIVCAILFWTLLGIFDFIKVEIDRNIDGHVRSNSPPFPDDRFHHLFWVVQISDIHVSRFHDPKRVPDFTRLLEEDLKVIDPHLVLATGDLTDAKSLDGIGSTQYKDEWQQYRDALQKSGVLKWTKWLDVRGNHDAFNVAELKSDSNMFRTHSVKGREEQYNYIENVHIDGSTYSFVAMDACPKPGPKRPFNFFGVLSNESLTELEELSRQTKNSNMTIWFGHYPTSVIVSPYPGVRHFMRGATAYLCGHLHTLAGLVPNMYTMQKSGGLELELGDWKDNRKFRVLAIDHDLMSFTDVSLDDWPIILVTNPKHALFTTPLHEPTGRIRQSSHIRILVFSNSDVESVTVSLDGKYHGLAVSSWKPLYVLPWQPSDFSTGVHEIEVTVKDILGNEKTIKQPFSVDNTKLSFDVLPRMILMANMASVMQVLFGAVYIVYMSVMLTLRFYWRHIAISASLPSCLVNCLKVWSTRLCMLANTDKIFYPLMIFNIYIAVGSN